MVKNTYQLRRQALYQEAAGDCTSEVFRLAAIMITKRVLVVSILVMYCSPLVAAFVVRQYQHQNYPYPSLLTKPAVAKRRLASSTVAVAPKEEQEEVLECAVRAAQEAGKLILGGRGADVRKTKANPRDLLTEVDGACQKIIEACVAETFPTHRFLGEESVEAGQAASSAALMAATSAGGSDWLWVVDPIDGTTNFASGLTLSAVSIGVAYKGEVSVGVIYDPFLDETFSAMAGRGAFCNGERIRTNAGPAMALQDAAHQEEEEGEGAAVLGEAVVFAGSPPAMNSMGPSLRGVAALMPKVRTIRMVGSAALMFAWVAAGRASAYFEADLNAWDVAAGAVLIREAGGAIVDMADPYGPPYCLATRRILATNGDPRLLRALHGVLEKARAVRLDGDVGG